MSSGIPASRPCACAAPSTGIGLEAIQKVLARWDMGPAHVAYVGDAPADIEAARAVGLLPLAVAWDTCASAEALARAGPHALFIRVEEFVRWVDALPPARSTERSRDPVRPLFGGIAGPGTDPSG